MSRMHFTRHPDDAGIFRSIKVYVDGEVAIKLRPGMVATIEVSPGSHTVQGRIDWVKSDLEEVFMKESTETTVDFWLPKLAVSGIFDLFNFTLGMRVS